MAALAIEAPATSPRVGRHRIEGCSCGVWQPYGAQEQRGRAEQETCCLRPSGTRFLCAAGLLERISLPAPAYRKWLEQPRQSDSRRLPPIQDRLYRVWRQQRQP